MAPPRRYMLPNEQLVEELARCREAGMPFAVAWERAVRPGRALVLTNATAPPEGAVRWPTDSSDRNAWRMAILDSRDEIRRAYERRPATARELAVTVLIDLLLGAADARESARPAAVARRGIAPRTRVRSAA